MRLSASSCGGAGREPTVARTRRARYVRVDEMSPPARRRGRSRPWTSARTDSRSFPMTWEARSSPHCGSCAWAITCCGEGPPGSRQADALEILDCSSNELRDVVAARRVRVAGGPERRGQRHRRAPAEPRRRTRARARGARGETRGLERAGSSTRARARALDESASAAARAARAIRHRRAIRAKRSARQIRNTTSLARVGSANGKKRSVSSRRRNERRRRAALANASRVVGLRRLRAANNRLDASTAVPRRDAAVFGAGGRVVDVRGNPLEPSVRSLLAEPGGVDAYIDMLLRTHAETARPSPAPRRRAPEDAARRPRRSRRV